MLCKKPMHVGNISWRHCGTRLKHALWNGVHKYVPGRLGILCPSAISVPWELEPRNLMVGRSRQWALCCALLVTLGQNVPGQMKSNLKRSQSSTKWSTFTWLYREVDRSNKMNNYFEKILFSESFRNGNSSAEPTVSAQPGGLRSRNRWRELICQVFWRRVIGHW